MPAKKDVDWSAVQRARDSGVPVLQLAKDYGISRGTIYARIHSNRNGHKRAKRPTSQDAATPKGVQLTDIIAGLKKRRDALNAAIEALDE